jgi:hypothetical protein
MMTEDELRLECLKRASDRVSNDGDDAASVVAAFLLGEDQPDPAPKFKRRERALNELRVQIIGVTPDE